MANNFKGFGRASFGGEQIDLGIDNSKLGENPVIQETEDTKPQDKQENIETVDNPEVETVQSDDDKEACDNASEISPVKLSNQSESEGDASNENPVEPSEDASDKPIEPEVSDDETSCDESKTSYDSLKYSSDDDASANQEIGDLLKSADEQSDLECETAEIAGGASSSEPECENQEAVTDNPVSDITNNSTEPESDEQPKNAGEASEPEAASESKPSGKPVKSVSKTAGIIAAVLVLASICGYGVYWNLSNSNNPVDRELETIDNPDPSVNPIVNPIDDTQGNTGNFGSTDNQDSSTSTGGETDNVLPDGNLQVTSDRFPAGAILVADPAKYSGHYVTTESGDTVDIGMYVDSTGKLRDSQGNKVEATIDEAADAYYIGYGYLTTDNVLYNNADIPNNGTKTIYIDGVTKICVDSITNHNNQNGEITVYVGTTSEFGTIQVYDIYVNNSLCPYGKSLGIFGAKSGFITVDWENIYSGANPELNQLSMSVVVVGSSGETLARAENISILEFVGA